MDLSIFNINKFNIIEDAENYYFLRALNNGDKNDLDNGLITNKDGKIIRVRTDRERYDGKTKYQEDDEISLEEMVDHIKNHHRTDTNCISLSLNANVSILYGRGYYSDKYVLIRVPKTNIGNTVYNAGTFLINEIETKIDTSIEDGKLDNDNISSLQSIDKVKTQEELNDIIDISKNKLFNNEDNETSVSYQALSEKQILEKNKIIAKLLIIKKNIIENIPNESMIQAIENAFSSLEFIHYGSIERENIIELNSAYTDMFSLLQQLPSDYPLIYELKYQVLDLLKKKVDIEEFEYKDNNEKDSFNDLHKRLFYLVKSRLRALSITEKFQQKITDTRFNSIFEYMKKHTYGVEFEVFNRLNAKGIHVSESVNLNFIDSEFEYFDKINKMSQEELINILINPELLEKL